MMSEHAYITIVAIITIGLIEAKAIDAGINGQLLVLVLTLIAGLAGYNFRKQILERFKD